MPILTQATLIDDSSFAKENLPKIRQLNQVLEIFDKLCVEEEMETEIYDLAIKIIDQLSHQPQPTKIKSMLRNFVMLLGYQDFKNTGHQSIIDYVSEISEQKMKSFEYLKI
jgi:UDP-N-acetylglucosamine enolpyruvyl transferase